MQVSRARNGSVGQRAADLVPRIRLELAIRKQQRDEPSDVDAKLIGTAAYLINQYLFESSRH